METETSATNKYIDERGPGSGHDEMGGRSRLDCWLLAIHCGYRVKTANPTITMRFHPVREQSADRLQEGKQRLRPQLLLFPKGYATKQSRVCEIPNEVSVHSGIALDPVRRRGDASRRYPICFSSRLMGFSRFESPETFRDPQVPRDSRERTRSRLPADFRAESSGSV